MKIHRNFRGIITLFFLQFTVFTAFGQECGVNGNYNWELIEVKVVDPASPLEPEMISGKWQIEGQAKIASVEELSDATLENIRKQVAKSKACAVYIDIYGAMDSAEGLYYYGVFE